MVIAYIILALMVGFAAGYIFTLRRNAAKINFLMDAVEDGEMNFRFNERSPLNRALNRLRKIFEKIKQDNEVESWSKLIRVLTHEIMNTVTPIAVLSESLAEDDSLDTKAGLETIASSSKNLINFVNSYRNLSKIERPKKKTILVKDLADKVLELNSKYLEESGAKCTLTLLKPDIMIYADEGQISQILINLIKNAVQAQSHLIEITADITTKDEVIIYISDDGVPINKEDNEQIFIPFYTTKEGGSGIGLSLSRQIMRLHNGSLDLIQSDENKTTFAMKFS